MFLSIQWVFPQVNGKSRDRVAIVGADCFGIVQMSLQFGNGAHTVMWGCTCVIVGLATAFRSDEFPNQVGAYLYYHNPLPATSSCNRTCSAECKNGARFAVEIMLPLRKATLISRSFSGLSSPFLKSASIELWAHSLATGPFGPQLRSDMLCRTASARSRT
jgi:hypothetical protein